MRYLLILLSFIFSQDTEELDLDAMWENTVWEEIENVTDESYEVEKVTAVAGVRGAEAEDEALQYLYYRKSMKGLSVLELQKALGKLILKRKSMSDDNPNIKRIDGYIKQLRKKESSKELWLAFSPIKSNYQNFMIQKATELGVTKFLPIIFDRTIVRKINFFI